MGKFLQLPLVILLIFITKINVINAADYLFVSQQNNSYYIETEQKFSWYNALIKCASMNMSLVTIDTEIKSQEITDILAELQVVGRQIHLWIGGAGRGNKFYWISTGKQFVYTNWATGIPYYQGDDTYCAQIHWTDDMKWSDYWCHSRFGFMCEYSLYHHCQEEMHTKLQEEMKKQVELKQKLEEMLSAAKVDSESRKFRDLILNINQSKC